MTIETANRLYELRKKKGLSQEELAEKLGVSRQAVSKWERSEASPDTDNLIALAKIYDLSLDELIFGKKTTEREAKIESEKKPEEKTSDGESDENKGDNVKSNIEISPTCILIDDEDGDKIKIDLSGIKIESKGSSDEDGGEEIKIGPSGIHIKSMKEDGEDGKTAYVGENGNWWIDNEDLHIPADDDEDGVVIIDSDGKNKIRITKKNKTKFWLEVPYAVICALAYLVCGFTNSFGGFGLSWIIFLTIPIYYSLVEAIYKRRFSEFSYSVLVAFIYLYLGLYQGNWHPPCLLLHSHGMAYSVP